jgi:hypothetical protein
MLYTTDELVTAVRSRLDEMNRDSVDTTRDILPALNRALEFAVDIYSRHYPDPFLRYEVLPLNGTDQEYNIPGDVFGDRIVRIEIKTSKNTYREVTRILYRDAVNYETDGTTAIPYYYTIVGRKIHFIPGPSGTYSARLWYVKEPEPLVLQQGRVTKVNIANNYVVVEGLGTDLTTQSDQLNNYVNIINGETGEVRGTLQIASISGDRITFRTTTSRSTVVGLPVSTSLTDLGATEDDYICVAEGTCIPYLGAPTSNFLIQYAIAEISRQLGVQSQEEEAILAKFEEQVKRTWAGRETTIRVAKRSQAFGVPIRPWFTVTRGK